MHSVVFDVVVILGAGAALGLLTIFAPPLARLFLDRLRAETEVRQYAQAMFPIVVVGTNEALVSLITYLIGFPVAKPLVARSSWSSRSGGFSGGGGSSGGGSSGSW